MLLDNQRKIVELVADNQCKTLQISALDVAIKTTAEIFSKSSERYTLALSKAQSDIQILSDILSDTIVRNAASFRDLKGLTDNLEFVRGDITTAHKALLLPSLDTTITLTADTPENMTFFNITPNPIVIRVVDTTGVSERLTLVPLRGAMLHLEVYTDSKCLLDEATTYFGVP